MEHIRRVLRTPQADYVGLSPSTLEKLRQAGDGPACQKAGRKIFVYRPEDLDAWLNSQRRNPICDAGHRE